MHRKEFRRLLRIGHGRALLYARNHDVAEFSDLILDACLHCYAIDPIFEGTRAAYLLDLIAFAPNKSFYAEEVIKSLKGSGDSWDAAQRFHFAACLASDGNEHAKKAMYENFQPGPRFAEHIGCEFVELDGLSGFLFVAERIGRILGNRFEEIDMGRLLWRCGEVCGEQETREALRKASKQNPHIDAYRVLSEQHRLRSKESWSELQRLWASSYEDLKPNLAAMKGYRISSWGQKASDTELARAASGLISAGNPAEQLSHLHPFIRRPFPLDPTVLFTLADSKNREVGRAAVRALTNLSLPATRDLAFRLVTTQSPNREHAVDMLRMNFAPGDHGILLRWFQEEEDPEILHSFASDLLHFWKQHPDETTEVPMLSSLYEKGPCSYHREFVVRQLLEQKALTDQMKTECAYDANDDIRKLVAEHV